MVRWHRGENVENKYRYVFDAPYSLHDARVRALERAGQNLWLRFENGYLALQKPPCPVDGDVRVEEVEWDFSQAFVLSKSGRMGSFRGRKMELAAFVETFGNCPFEILDECFGYHQVQYTGLLSLPDGALAEAMLCIWHRGPIVYVTS